LNKFKAQDTTFTQEEFNLIREKQVITVAYPKFASFTIKNLYEFFMVFVVLCGIAGAILALISPKLKKMMHGVN